MAPQNIYLNTPPFKSFFFFLSNYTYNAKSKTHHQQWDNKENDFFFGQMAVFRPLRLPDNSLRCMQFPIPHPPNYYKEKSLGGDSKILAKGKWIQVHQVVRLTYERGREKQDKLLITNLHYFCSKLESILHQPVFSKMILQ